jgi:hypothetical protein
MLLGPEDLCRISRVCYRWFCVSYDESLWRRRLKIDAQSWSIIGHSTNPDYFAENCPTLTCREMYVDSLLTA